MYSDPFGEEPTFQLTKGRSMQVDHVVPRYSGAGDLRLYLAYCRAGQREVVPLQENSGPLDSIFLLDPVNHLSFAPLSKAHPNHRSAR